MNNKTIAEDILHVLQSAEFDRWYQEEFNDFMVGDACAPTREEILKTIEDLFWKRACKLPLKLHHHLRYEN